MSNKLYTGSHIVAKTDQYDGNVKCITEGKHYPIKELSRVAVTIANDRGNDCSIYHHEVSNQFITDTRKP